MEFPCTLCLRGESSQSQAVHNSKVGEEAAVGLTLAQPMLRVSQSHSSCLPPPPPPCFIHKFKTRGFFLHAAGGGGKEEEGGPCPRFE